MFRERGVRALYTDGDHSRAEQPESVRRVVGAGVFGKRHHLTISEQMASIRFWVKGQGKTYVTKSQVVVQVLSDRKR